jgi:hypothetical protein
VTQARAELLAHTANAAASQGESTAINAAVTSGLRAAAPLLPSRHVMPPSSGAYIPSAPVPRNTGPSLVQPISQAAADAVAERAPKYMQSSLTANADAYEADPRLLQQVRAAGGYDSDAWRTRYRTEALNLQALFFAVGE